MWPKKEKHLENSLNIDWKTRNGFTFLAERSWRPQGKHFTLTITEKSEKVNSRKTTEWRYQNFNWNRYRDFFSDTKFSETETETLKKLAKISKPRSFETEMSISDYKQSDEYQNRQKLVEGKVDNNVEVG